MPNSTLDSPSGALELDLPKVSPEMESDPNLQVAPELKTTETAPKKSARAIEREEIWAGFSPTELRWGNLSWVVISFITAMHLGALAAPFFFSWSALGAALVLHWLTCSIGVCMAYHRCLSHKSLKLRNPAKFIANYFGVISGEGSPLMWASTHRVHHARSDKEGDPHSPHDGPWWSHLLWVFVQNSPRKFNLLVKHYSPDLEKDPQLQMFERTYGLWLWGTGLGLGAIGYAIGGWVGALSWITWAFCLRMVVAYHSTWFVNSATHLWGYRNYDTTDHSKNLWWVAVMAYGEGWHNNHHAHPRLAKAGHRWWELDPTWWTISTLRALGLAYDVDDRVPAVGSREADEDEA